MKLYTEEQLLNTVKAIQDYNDTYDEKIAQDMIEKHLKSLEPFLFSIGHSSLEPVHHYGEATEMIGAEEYNPYCKECDGCGQEGCCSPLNCKQSANGRYCVTYLMDLKFGYIMNSFFCNEIFGLISEELKEKYDQEFDKQWDLIYDTNK